MQHSQANSNIHRHTTQNRPQKLKKHLLQRHFSRQKQKKSRNIQFFLYFACMVYFFDIPLHHQTRRDHILVEKQTLERWQSGRLHRSWKPTYWKVPGVRIPLSPQEIRNNESCSWFSFYSCGKLAYQQIGNENQMQTPIGVYWFLAKDSQPGMGEQSEANPYSLF